jgi:hypothetical protein
MIFLQGECSAQGLSQATHPTKIVFLTLMTGDDFIREAKRYGYGFVAKSRLHADLVPALYAAIEESSSSAIYPGSLSRPSLWQGEAESGRVQRRYFADHEAF